MYYARAMQTISLRLPDTLVEDLDRAAKARRVTKSSFVRESLEKTLHTKPSKEASCFDLAQDLAGSVKGLPRDLAKNPKYMDGFGE
jgi:predicted DNA-binding protein